jgi:transposase-like protein
VRCAECGKWFSATTGTPLHKSKLDARQLVLVSLLLSQGVAARRIAETTGLTAETVALWRARFQALAQAEAR